MISIVKVTKMVIVYQRDSLKRKIIWEIVKIKILTSIPIIHHGMIIQILTEVTINVNILNKNLPKITEQGSHHLYNRLWTNFNKFTKRNLEAMKVTQDPSLRDNLF